MLKSPEMKILTKNFNNNGETQPVIILTYFNLISLKIHVKITNILCARKYSID